MNEAMQAYMMCFVGLPYLWGGDDPINGFDCSGWAQEFLSAFSMDPPGDQTAQALHDYFAPEARRMGNARGTGALYFYGKSKSEITHVAVGYDETQIVEAGGGRSTTTSIEAAAKENAYMRMRRFDYRKDLVAVYMPRYGYMKP